MLTETGFRSTDVPPAERFEHWRAYIAGSSLPLDIEKTDAAGETGRSGADEEGEATGGPRAPGFTASQRLLDLGDVRLWKIEHSPMRMRRTTRLIRSSDPGLYHLSLPLTGTMRVDQAGDQFPYSPRDLVLLDTSRPYTLDAVPDPHRDRILGTGLFVPRELLPLPQRSIDHFLNRPLPGSAGIGDLLAQYLTRVWTQAPHCGPSDGTRLGMVAVELLSALLAHALERDSGDPRTPESRRRTLVLRIRAHIAQHLSDPRLSPGTVAAAHHISLSYLHRLFETEATTVAAWIRHQRLERARHDLGDTTQRHIPVHAIAARWGFPRAAEFSRAFRTAYGMPPRDYRELRTAHGHRPA
ncbi:helix-turn-helix domain-containing protein [Streptomyces sp. NPDC046215]|uniref:Helix-turn-helix domain-containing protein n=1 Tax=Streptomyces stramineus TaxID=173861 RepID=A0ABP3JTY8_9ACTN